MSKIAERGSTHVYKVNRISKEKIEEMTGLCIHDEPPFCNAACPLKVDTRAFLSFAASGNWKKALQIYEKAVPFPLILSRGCDAPCEGRCRLREVGDGVRIRDIEHAAAASGERTVSGGVFRMKKKKTAALFGSGLFVLFLAGELEKKMYPVTVFTECADQETFLRTAAPDLPGQDFALELGRLKTMDIRFVCGETDLPVAAREKGNGFDILCMSGPVFSALHPGEETDRETLTWRNAADGRMIVGGSLQKEPESVLQAAFAAKRAALSVDRLAQNLDPHNSRGSEGATETRLYTDLSQAAQLCSVKPSSSSGYTPDEAAAEAKRCLQCRCEECMKSCAFLQKFQKFPNLLAREIYNNTQIIMGDHPLNRVMNACALCGQCTVVCPNGFDMAKVCKNARENMVSTDKMSLAVHEFALLDMLFSNEEAFLSRPQPGYEGKPCRYVFFPGCQAVAVSPETARAAYEDLCSRLEGGVALMLGCCGAICDWAGRYEMYDETRAFLDRELEKLGNPVVIAGCPTCKKQLSSHSALQVKGVWDILNRIGLPPENRKASRGAVTPPTENEKENAAPIPRRVAVHDSCGARGDAETQQSVRKLLEKLGCRITETEYSGDSSPCCGYGGLTSYVNRELAKEMTQKCLSRSEELYVTYCMACRDRFAREGRESRHVLELVYGSVPSDPPDISAKRYNRLNLKNTLLKELWHEETEHMEPEFEIQYAPEAKALIADRMILQSDVEDVLRNLRKTGSAVYDRTSGHCVTCCRLDNVTFWVVYDEIPGGYLVHRAYSHRMTVEKREG